MQIEAAKILMKNLLEVVSYLHAVGICHRDLKPDNLIVADDMSIKLIDFNVSVWLTGDTTYLKEIIGGTGLKQWSAPETR